VLIAHILYVTLSERIIKLLVRTEPAKTHQRSPADFFQNSSDLIQEYGKLIYVTYGTPIKKYAQTTLSVD
jgi:hypothetical protein